MLARHDGQVILVQGGIPGERVRARIGRVEKQLAFAETVEVVDPSADRRKPPMDLACGGCLYGHIGYERQRALKGEVVRDAFVRLGRIEVEAPAVAASPETAYRMRARLHVRRLCRRERLPRSGRADLLGGVDVRRVRSERRLHRRRLPLLPAERVRGGSGGMGARRVLQRRN